VAPLAQSGTGANVASGAAAQPPLNTSIGVAPKESWSLEVVLDAVDFVSSHFFAIWGAWAAWQKLTANWSLIRAAGRLNVNDWGIPSLGRYHCTGNSSTDEKVDKLTSSLNTNNNVLLISGPKSVNKFLIAKSIAAKQHLPLLSINCSQLANITKEIPPELLDTFAKKVAQACRRHNTDGVVLLFDGIENLVSAGHGAFIDRLKRALSDPSSKLRSGKTIIVGTRNTGDRDACDSTQKETLEGLSKTFSRELTVEPPKTADERFELLYSRIISFMRYEAPKTSQAPYTPTLWSRIVSPLKWFEAPQKPAIRPPLYSSEYELSSGDQEFLRAIARAMPEIADDNRVTELALAIVSPSAKITHPLTGDAFKSFVLEYALGSIKGPMPQRQTTPSCITRDAHAVICEAFVALALDRTVLALGAQARGGNSYVCRERCDPNTATIADLLKEALIAKARLLSYSFPETIHNPLNAAGNEIEALNHTFTSTLQRAAELLAKTTDLDSRTLQAEKAMEVTQIAEVALAHLFSDANKANYEALHRALCPADPDNPPTELTNGALDELVDAFDLTAAQKDAEKLLNPSPRQV
jgi:hypothetical protein